MFHNSVVSDAELSEFRNRTNSALLLPTAISGRLRQTVEMFQRVPHIATVWSCDGIVRVEKGKIRTRQPHYLTFVIAESGIQTLQDVYAAWQTVEDGDKMSVTLARHRHHAKPDTSYPAWTFKMNVRPDHDVVARLCNDWEKIASLFVEVI